MLISGENKAEFTKVYVNIFIEPETSEREFKILLTIVFCLVLICFFVFFWTWLKPFLVIPAIILL